MKLTNIIQKIGFLSIVFLFVQCESGVVSELKFDYSGDQLTINGYLSPNHIQLQAAKTVNIYEPYRDSDFLVNNIQVFVIDENQDRIEIKSADGFNFVDSVSQLKVGHKYQVQVIAEDYETLLTEEILIPSKTPIHQFTQSFYEDNSARRIHRIDFSFQDSLTNDFYFSDYSIRKDRKNVSTLYFPIEDIRVESCYGRSIFNDICFNGEEVQLSYGVRVESQFNTVEYQLADTIIFRFGKVSKSFFDASIINSSSDDLIEGINEQAPSYTNVKNGYGVVYGQNWEDYYIAVE